MSTLEKEFEAELIYKMQCAKKDCKYNPTRFNQMLSKKGGVATAKQLIKTAIATGKTSDGFTTLYMYGRLDLTMEESVCNMKYSTLFLPHEIEYCKHLLGK